MKKILTLLLVLAMVFSIAACGEQEQNPSNDGSTPGPSQTEGNSDIPGNTDEPSNTKNPDNSDDMTSIEGFLKVYGFTKEDVTPAQLVSFEDIEMKSSANPGEAGSEGYVTINVDKDATKQTDIDTWFESIYAKMAKLSKDGKLYGNAFFSKEATLVEDLKAGVLWKTYPGGTCFYYYDLPVGTAKIMVITEYDTENGVYRMCIAVDDSLVN